MAEGQQEAKRDNRPAREGGPPHREGRDNREGRHREGGGRPGGGRPDGPPEIDIDKVSKIMGMDITFVTTANTDAEAFALLKEIGIPFVKK